MVGMAANPFGAHQAGRVFAGYMIAMPIMTQVGRAGRAPLGFRHAQMTQRITSTRCSSAAPVYLSAEFDRRLALFKDREIRDRVASPVVGTIVIKACRLT